MTTHHGDHGETSLFDGTRVEKVDERIEALGAVDELNSWLGFAAAQEPALTLTLSHGERELGKGLRLGDRLRWVQERLLEVGADLANPGGRARSTSLAPGSLQTLDAWLAEYRDALPPLRHFILPGGHPLAAALQVARSVCRRAERSVWRVVTTPAPEGSPAFLNRLSDVLFEMARAVNAAAGTEDPQWCGRDGS